MSALLSADNWEAVLTLLDIIILLALILFILCPYLEILDCIPEVELRGRGVDSFIDRL